MKFGGTNARESKKPLLNTDRIIRHFTTNRKNAPLAGPFSLFFVKRLVDPHERPRKSLNGFLFRRFFHRWPKDLKPRALVIVRSVFLLSLKKSPKLIKKAAFLSLALDSLALEGSPFDFNDCIIPSG